MNQILAVTHRTLSAIQQMLSISHRKEKVGWVAVFIVVLNFGALASISWCQVVIHVICSSSFSSSCSTSSPFNIKSPLLRRWKHLTMECVVSCLQQPAVTVPFSPTHLTSAVSAVILTAVWDNQCFSNSLKLTHTANQNQNGDMSFLTACSVIDFGTVTQLHPTPLPCSLLLRHTGMRLGYSFPWTLV